MIETARRVARYGWVPDLPDPRDQRFSVVAPVPTPSHVDLRFDLAVYDQGQLGSCTANAIAAALQFEQHRQGLPLVMPSRLMIYYEERRLEHTIRHDAGAMIRDGVKQVAKVGVCAEESWPYDGSAYPPNHLMAQRPAGRCYDEAKHHRAIDYARVPQSPSMIRQVLAQGYPIIFGFTVFEGFESEHVAKTGHLEMPSADEANLGGHAVLCVGYDDPTETVIVRNSWGPRWGLVGHFHMPFDYITNSDLADDLWVIRLIS